MKYSVSPVVRTAVDVTNAADLPKLMEGLKRLAKSDPLVVCTTTPTGEHVIAAAGELHLEICIKDLRDDFMKGAPIKVSDPVVSFNETILKASSQTVVTKSANAHNRIYATGGPIDEELIKALDKGEINAEQDLKSRSRMLTETYKWDPEASRRIWSFGLPPDGLTNLLVENTKGVQYMAEIKDHVCTGFQQVTLAGVYCNEALRGIRVDINDVVMHPDAIHRGAGQISPPTKDAVFGLQICSEPALMEPMYMCDITVPETAVSGVYTTLSARRGQVEAKIDRPGTPLTQIRAYLPVLESFGFTQLLRQNTSGKAFPQMIFSHYANIQSDIKDNGSQANTVCMNIRKRKGLKLEMPSLGDFHVKL
jgi:elongation factor 2